MLRTPLFRYRIALNAGPRVADSAKRSPETTGEPALGLDPSQKCPFPRDISLDAQSTAG